MNLVVCAHFLEEHDLPWATVSFQSCYVFIQDGMASHVEKNHVEKITQKGFKSHKAEFWYMDLLSACRPCLNCTGFSIWPVLKMDVCATTHSSIAGLKLPFETAWPHLAENTLRRWRLSKLMLLDAVLSANEIVLTISLVVSICTYL